MKLFVVLKLENAKFSEIDFCFINKIPYIIFYVLYTRTYYKLSFTNYNKIKIFGKNNFFSMIYTIIFVIGFIYFLYINLLIY